MTATATADGRAGAEHGRRYWIGLARAFGGAIFFSLPLLMTMEMWSLGSDMGRYRLALLMALMVPLLVSLDHYAGFRRTTTWRDDVVDGLVAYGVGIVSAVVVLLLFNVLNVGLPLREWVGKVALQAVPASLGAVLASSQLGGGGNEDADRGEGRRDFAGYGAELLFMLAGAVVLAFNVAPTEEMILIAFKMTPWHALALATVSLLMMHAFVYAVEFHGTPSNPAGSPVWSLFLRFTLVGYAVALLVSAYVLWTFGRYEQAGFGVFALEVIVLGFPASLGAAAARLII